MDTTVVVSRLVQYAAVSAVGGSSLFFLYGYRPEPGVRWPARLVAVGAILGVAGAVGWLMTQAAALGDAPGDAWIPVKVWAVAADTGFGRAALVRIGLLALALGAATLKPRVPPLRALAGLGLAAAASFAWTGHGSADDGLAGYAHLTADVVHSGAAAIWIGALFGLVILLARARRARMDLAAENEAAALAAFSRIGPLVVGALVLSGLGNGGFMVGLSGVPTLAHTLYGQLLILKLVLFALMLGLAAANRYVLTPRLERATASGQAGSAERLARLSLLTETALALGVLILVSWLGTLSPTGEM